MAEIEGYLSSHPAPDLRMMVLEREANPWRCNSGPTANIATRIFRQIRWRLEFAAMSAHSVRIASRASSIMFARTAAAVSCHARSGRQGNGVRGYRWRSALPRRCACICRTATRTLPRIRLGSGVCPPRDAEVWPNGCTAPCGRHAKSSRRRDRAFHLAKADAVPRALAPAVKGERIPVFEKAPFNAAGQLDRLGPVPGDFQQAAALAFVRPADGPAAQEIADIHGAAGRGV